MSHRFISESDIAAKKQKLKEAWDATKGEDDPEFPPEEPPPDNRPLFHRLEEQRMKKQDEYDDAHKSVEYISADAMTTTVVTTS